METLRFTLAVLATVGAVYGVTVLAMSLEPAVTMPAARPVYESHEALRRLSAPCPVSYAYRRANGRWVQGCAK